MGRLKKSVSENRTREYLLSRAGGMDDGLARTVERTNAIRNGQDPRVVAVAEAIWTPEVIQEYLQRVTN
jgi:hypothetical protein